MAASTAPYHVKTIWMLNCEIICPIAPFLPNITNNTKPTTVGGKTKGINKILLISDRHDCFRPVPGRFKNYIALSKPNGYRSLHTSVIGAGGQPLEVQIRTWEIHNVAEYGIAAHWKYKEFGSVPDGKLTNGNSVDKYSWLSQLVEFQKDIKDDQEYIDSLKQDLYDGEIYVFTPKGDVHCLPRGATPVDFAYQVHTEIGNHCVGALVNQRMVTLDRKALLGMWG